MVIPSRSELRKAIARGVLAKQSSLNGHELQFLRKTAGLTIENLGQRLNVVPQTIKAWEASSALRLTQDLATRLLIASVLFGEPFLVFVPSLFDSIRWSEASVPESRIRWDAVARRWESLSVANNCKEKPLECDHQEESTAYEAIWQGSF